MHKPQPKLKPSTLIHIHARVNGFEKLFVRHSHYTYFLKKYIFHIAPIATTLELSLTPSDCHFLVKVHDAETLCNTFSEKYVSADIESRLPELLLKQFQNLFISYAKRFNLEYSRTGKLFASPFNRKLIYDKVTHNQIVELIRLAPVAAGYCTDPENWPYSSLATSGNRHGGITAVLLETILSQPSAESVK